MKIKFKIIRNRISDYLKLQLRLKTATPLISIRHTSEPNRCFAFKTLRNP